MGARQLLSFPFSYIKPTPTFSLIQLLNQETWVLGFGAVSSAKVRLTQLPNLRDIGARLQPFSAEFFCAVRASAPKPLSSACARVQANLAGRRQPHEGPRHGTGTPVTPTAPVFFFLAQLSLPRIARIFRQLSSYRKLQCSNRVSRLGHILSATTRRRRAQPP